MKLRIPIFALIAFVAGGGAGLFFYLRQDPVAVVVSTVLAGGSPEEAGIKLTPELRGFLDWYEPMVSDAPPEVVDIMKRFDPEYRARGHRDRELEEIVPANEWIKRHLGMGVEIEDYDDYSDYLQDRWSIYRAAKDPEELQRLKDRHDLDADASFEEVIDAEIREDVLFKRLLDQAMAADPWVYGGSLGKDGVFIPIRYKTVYVQSGTIGAGSGVPRWVVYELRDRDIGRPPSRRIPSDIDVIFLDRKGQRIAEGLHQRPDGSLEPGTRRNDKLDAALGRLQRSRH